MRPDPEKDRLVLKDPGVSLRLERDSRPDEASGCIVWTKARDHRGYGRVYIQRASLAAHRVSYILARGLIPEGLVLDHLCRNRACINPEHLEPVTVRVNILRGVALSAVNASKPACPAGHPYDDQNTYLFRGGRHCRACNREASRLCKARSRAAA